MEHLAGKRVFRRAAAGLGEAQAVGARLAANRAHSQSVAGISRSPIRNTASPRNAKDRAIIASVEGVSRSVPRTSACDKPAFPEGNA